MTIHEFMELGNDGTYSDIIIYDKNTQKNVYVGLYYNMPYEFEFRDVLGWEIEMRSDKPYMCIVTE